ncbi:MAG: GGDEF domain-containing protein [Deltaproteobacteria bacterium]|nr:GGDEF domain-containing protein [Deltaproteobacteria bacterium]
MYCSITQKVILFLFPAAVLAAVYAYLPYSASLPAPWRELLPYATYLVFAMGILLSIHFNRSRVCFVFLMLTLFYWNGSLVSSGSGAGAAAQRVDGILCFLFPVNITLFCLMREKGIFSSAGRKRFLFLFLQAAVLVILSRTGQAEAQQETGEWLRRTAEGYRGLPLLAFPVMGVCGALIAFKSYVRHSLIDSAFLGVLAAIAIVFGAPSTGDIQTVFLFAAGLILTISILQDSHNMAYRDDLTGLLSRRALNEQLEGLGRRFTIAMLDLDHFKRLNDSYGHDVGDQVLRMAASKMRSAGGGGKAYRYGGEEFSIIFPGKGIDDVLPHLEALRADIASYRFDIRGADRPGPAREGRRRRAGAGADTHVSLTVSIGIAESDGLVRTPREVLAVADEALYRAKQKGRNRVSAAPRK